jgi:hypothetical protein
MFSDPLSVTVATVTKSLPKVGSSLNQSVFRTADRAYQFAITQTSGRRNQARVRLDNSKVITDPLASDRNVPVSMSVYTVVDTPLTGYTAAEVKDQLIAHADWLKAAGNADKLVGGEI